MIDHPPPSPNGDNGRGAGGRFTAGNPGGPGNPYARRVAHVRSLILDAVSDDDLRAIVAKLVEQAKAGDMAAIRELFTRLAGKPVEPADPDRVDVDALELDRQRIAARQARREAKEWARIGA